MCANIQLQIRTSANSSHAVSFAKWTLMSHEAPCLVHLVAHN